MTFKKLYFNWVIQLYIGAVIVTLAFWSNDITPFRIIFLMVFDAAAAYFLARRDYQRKRDRVVSKWPPPSKRTS